MPLLCSSNVLVPVLYRSNFGSVHVIAASFNFTLFLVDHEIRNYALNLIDKLTVENPLQHFDEVMETSTVKTTPGDQDRDNPPILLLPLVPNEELKSSKLFTEF